MNGLDRRSRVVSTDSFIIIIPLELGFDLPDLYKNDADRQILENMPEMKRVTVLEERRT